MRGFFVEALIYSELLFISVGFVEKKRINPHFLF